MIYSQKIFTPVLFGAALLIAGENLVSLAKAYDCEDYNSCTKACRAPGARGIGLCMGGCERLAKRASLDFKKCPKP